MKTINTAAPNWRTLRDIYLGIYDGPPVNANIGNAVIKNSELRWSGGTTDGIMDSWFAQYCNPPREFEFKFTDAEGYKCSGYYDDLGYHYWTGREMTTADIANIDKHSIKYRRCSDAQDL